MPQSVPKTEQVPGGWPVPVEDEVVAARVERVSVKVSDMERKLLLPMWIAASAAVLAFAVAIWIAFEVRHANAILSGPYVQKPTDKGD